MRRNRRRSSSFSTSANVTSGEPSRLGRAGSGINGFRAGSARSSLSISALLTSPVFCLSTRRNASITMVIPSSMSPPYTSASTVSAESSGAVAALLDCAWNAGFSRTPSPSVPALSYAGLYPSGDISATTGSLPCGRPFGTASSSSSSPWLAAAAMSAAAVRRDGVSGMPSSAAAAAAASASVSSAIDAADEMTTGLYSESACVVAYFEDAELIER